MATQPYLDFVTYCNTHITDDEKGEAQTFLDRFFTGLGYADGCKEAAVQGPGLADWVDRKERFVSVKGGG